MTWLDLVDMANYERWQIMMMWYDTLMCHDLETRHDLKAIIDDLSYILLRIEV
jgi:hypothetical protein